MKRLEGKTITGIFIGDRTGTIDNPREHEPNIGEFIKFTTDAGDVMFRLDGDCCSESWFSDITGYDALVGATVTLVEPVEFSEEEQKKQIEDGRCRQDVDEIYGYKITTDKGRADIWFRNSSNGYYGGSCEDYPAQPDSRWGRKDEWAKVSWRQITDDWTA
jgi:hypothetical protein